MPESCQRLQIGFLAPVLQEGRCYDVNGRTGWPGETRLLPDAEASLTGNLKKEKKKSGGGSCSSKSGSSSGGSGGGGDDDDHDDNDDDDDDDDADDDDGDDGDDDDDNFIVKTIFQVKHLSCTEQCIHVQCK